MHYTRNKGIISMTNRQIDTSGMMPTQSWRIVSQPSLQSSAASSLPEILRAPNESQATQAQSKRQIPPIAHTFEDKLFENAADLKITLSQIVMHLEPEWRAIIFRQLDYLLDLNNWEEDSSLIRKSTFITFLRFIIYAAPARVPSIGVGYTGNLLAAWRHESQRVDVEFLQDDNASLTFARQGTHSREIVGWRGHVADLKNFIMQNKMIACFEGEAP
jgi:hypothetical protein